eukprot:TRINITY_DN704_c3_g1_i1.p1 TRINITY_DN704_c3_g1~~TRINITY_DN704_c3_g1_i1.p1  ORF type:complete len:222 (+),score=47.09 TRINITY_DN704_c3_g1_i1:308-973(+)
MASVRITGIQVLNNPAPWNSKLQFEISFESTTALKEDLEWSLTYVGSAESTNHDQQLATILLGPIALSSYKFVLEADPPNLNEIPTVDVLGVTVLLLSGSYRKVEFARIGYYVKNFYQNEELAANPPTTPRLEHISRMILADQPRLTYFPNPWDTATEGPTEEAFTRTYEMKTNAQEDDSGEEEDSDMMVSEDDSDESSGEEDESSESLGSSDDMIIDDDE